MAQGLRKGRVFSPLLINIFFSNDADIFTAHVQKQQSKTGPETAL